jgi:hypothetical protein
MVSKKKAKGQARKAAKARKEVEKKGPPSTDDTAALEVQMQRLFVKNATNALGLGSGSGSGSGSGRCFHGVDHTQLETYAKFVRLVGDNFNDAIDKFQHEQTNPFTEIIDKVMLDEYGEVLQDTAKMELIASIFAATATHAIMDGAPCAYAYAAFAEYFKQYLANLRETQSCFNWGKIMELYLGKFEWSR